MFHFLCMILSGCSIFTLNAILDLVIFIILLIIWNKETNIEMSNAKAFANSWYHQSVLKVREFMFNDIEKTSVRL